MTSPERETPPARRRRVLFLCTGNSARSQMAEALTRRIAGDRFEAVSAGTDPRASVHPVALAVLEARHVSTAGLAPKDLATFAGQSFDYVITTCDRAQEQCPIFPGAEVIHWSFPDPAEAGPDRQRQAFDAVFHGLSQRIRLLLVVDQRSDVNTRHGS